MKKLIMMLAVLSTVSAPVLADTSVLDLTCITEAMIKDNKTKDNILFIHIKQSDDKTGYATSEYLKPDGTKARGLTYFKGDKQSPDNHNSILFTTRQNAEDLHKDADFMVVDFTNVGSAEQEMYRAATLRGNDGTVKNRIGYFCGITK
ncbi:hypothetical protein [Kluyvera georgiana]|uniref:hypothetical protein n=1 Tax=Kluyvera georgiana TaxID=73098 RepID=UPI00321F72FA